MTLHAKVQALGALGVCAAIVVCILYVTKPMAQSAKEAQPQAGSNASPIYGITIPAGYRDWRLISVGHLAGGNLKQLRAQLGNDIAIKAFREGKLPFPQRRASHLLRDASSIPSWRLRNLEVHCADSKGSVAAKALRIRDLGRRSPSRVRA